MSVWWERLEVKLLDYTITPFQRKDSASLRDVNNNVIYENMYIGHSIRKCLSPLVDFWIEWTIHFYSKFSANMENKVMKIKQYFF
jgi:hypothetical protein